MPVSHLQQKVQKQKSLKIALKKAGFVKILPINNNFFSGMMGTESNSGAIVAVLFSDTSDQYQIEVTRGSHKQKLEHVDKSELDNELKNLYKQLSSKATASASRKFKFKDGLVITASTVEEAKAKHKVMADNKSEEGKKKEDLTKEEKSLAKKYGFTSGNKDDNLGNYELASKWVPNSHNSIYIHLVKSFHNKPSYRYYVSYVPYYGKNYIDDYYFDILSEKESGKYESLEDCLEDASKCFKRLAKLVSYISYNVQYLRDKAKNFKV